MNRVPFLLPKDEARVVAVVNGDSMSNIEIEKKEQIDQLAEAKQNVIEGKKKTGEKKKRKGVEG